MGRLFSIFETFINLFVAVGDFLTTEGAKSLGLNRFRQFGGGRSKKSKGPLEDPFDPAPKKRGFLDPPDLPSRIVGHSLVNNTLGGNSAGEPILDYADLSAKKDYVKGLTSEYKKAMISGFGESSIQLRSALATPPKLARGRDGVGPPPLKAHRHQACEKNLKRGIFKDTAEAVSPSSSLKTNREAGRRRDNGPGGISHKSVRNFIKF